MAEEEEYFSEYSNEEGGEEAEAKAKEKPTKTNKSEKKVVLNIEGEPRATPYLDQFADRFELYFLDQEKNEILRYTILNDITFSQLRNFINGLVITTLKNSRKSASKYHMNRKNKSRKANKNFRFDSDYLYDWIVRKIMKVNKGYIKEDPAHNNGNYFNWAEEEEEENTRAAAGGGGGAAYAAREAPAPPPAAAAPPAVAAPLTEEEKNIISSLEVLGLETTLFDNKKERANDILKQKYKELALIKHPNKGGSNAEFQELGKAYEFLKEIIEKYIEATQGGKRKTRKIRRSKSRSTRKNVKGKRSYK